MIGVIRQISANEQGLYILDDLGQMYILDDTGWHRLPPIIESTLK